MDKRKVGIIGSGAAGWTAAIYAARSDLQPIIFTGFQPGGQLTITTDVENYPGFAEPIMGPFLMEQMRQQAINVGVEVISGEISKVDFSSYPFKCYQNETEYIFESVIIATGAQARWLGLATEEKFKGYGVSACATCDGFFYKNKDVMVVGGGNTAVEEALHLTKFAKKVYLVHRRDKLRAEKLLQNRLFANSKIEPIWDHQLVEVLGDEEPLNVTGALVENTKTGEKSKILLNGIFIAIGHKPNSAIFTDYIELDSGGYIVTSPGSTRTNIAGVFAAGDVQDSKYRQAVTAAGTGCMAALDVEKFLNEK